MKILITGATGFIGTKLGQVLSQDNQVYCLLRNENSFLEDYFIPVFADLTDPKFVNLLPEEIDCVIHLAQSLKYRDFPEGVLDINRINVDSTLELLDWSRAKGVKKFIFASTANVYGPTDKLLTESCPSNPNSFYGASKLAAENIIKPYAKFFKIDVLRFFTVYGPGQSGMLIPKITQKIFDGKPIHLAEKEGIYLSPIFIDDACSIIQTLISVSSKQQYRLINMCGDEITTLDKVVTTIEKISGKKGNIRITDDKKIFLAGSNSYLKKIIGDFHFTTIETGLNVFLKAQTFSAA